MLTDILRKFRRGDGPLHLNIGGAFAGLQSGENRVLNLLRRLAQPPMMAQEHCHAQDSRGRIGDILPGDIRRRPVNRLRNGDPVTRA